MEHYSRIVHSDSEGYLIEQALIRENSNYLIMAPHGEEIEIATAVQAEHLSNKLKGDLWTVKGLSKDGNGFSKWHKTSTELFSEEFTLLEKLQNYNMGISFHGLKNPEGICIGGTTNGKKLIKEKLDEKIPVSVSVSGKNSKNAGISPKNVINRFSKESVQIEQGPVTRESFGDEVAETISQILKEDF